MLRQIIDMETDEDFEDFHTIMDKVRGGCVVATLKQLNAENGNFIDLSSVVVNRPAIINITTEALYIAIPNMSANDTRRVRGLYTTYLQRATERVSQELPNDFVLMIDSVKSKEENDKYVYYLNGYNPLFASSDGDKDLWFVFPIDRAGYGKDEVSLYDIDVELAGDKYRFVQELDNDSEFNSIFGGGDEEETE